MTLVSGADVALDDSAMDNSKEARTGKRTMATSCLFWLPSPAVPLESFGRGCAHIIPNLWSSEPYLVAHRDNPKAQNLRSVLT